MQLRTASGAACITMSGCVDDEPVHRRIQINRIIEERPVHSNENKISTWGDGVIEDGFRYRVFGVDAKIV